MMGRKLPDGMPRTALSHHWLWKHSSLSNDLKELIFQSDGKPYLCLTLNAKKEQEAYTFHASKVNSHKHLTLDKPIFVEGLSLIPGLYSQVAYFQMAFP